MKMKKVIIVHGSSPNDRENIKKYNLLPQNERGWIGWIKKELVNRDIDCIAPLMPENWAPKYEKWKKEFEKIKISENDVLIGWSSGGAFLVRWLGTNKVKAKKLILVAPVIANENLEEGIIKDFHNFKINPDIKKRFDEIILIESDNDSEGILEAGKKYSNELSIINPIILHNKGHFTGHKMGIEFPELLEEVLR